MSIGLRLITAYFAVAYWLPMAGNFLFRDHIVSSYKTYPLTAYSVLELLAVYILFVFLHVTKIPLFPPLDTSAIRPIVAGAGQTYAKLRLLFGLTAIAIGAFNFSAGLNSYRYSAEGLSEIGSPLLFAGIIVNVMVTVDLFYSIFASHGKALSGLSRRYCENLVLSLALVVGANGIAGMFIALVCLFYSAFPRTFRQLIFVRKAYRYGKATLWAMSSLAVFLLIFAVAWYSGSIIKVSSSSDMMILLNEPEMVYGGIVTDAPLLESFFYYLIERMSIFYYSLLFTVEAYGDELHYGSSVIGIPLQTFLFRLDYVFGGIGSSVKPDIGTVMQLNYQLLTAGPVRSREGSSPGLVASFNYVFAFPFNIILCSLYLRWLCKACNFLLRRDQMERISVLGILLLLHFLGGVFQSPFDLLVIFDESVMYAVLLLALYIKSSHDREGRASASVSSKRSVQWLRLREKKEENVWTNLLPT